MYDDVPGFERVVDDSGELVDGSVPGSSDVVCVPAGRTADLRNGSTLAAESVQGAGTLMLSYGSLSLSSASSIAALTIAGGTLTGGGDVTVTSLLSWSTGIMSGAGTTVLASGAAGSIADATLSRTLDNKGTLDASATARFFGTSSALLSNEGTFTHNMPSSSGRGLNVATAGATPRIVNTGLFRKTSGAMSDVDWVFENRGEVQVQTGTLMFSGGGDAGQATGVWSGAGTTAFNGSGVFRMGTAQVSGTFSVWSADVSVGDIQGGSVQIDPGSLSLTDSSKVSHIDSLALQNGSLGGPADLVVASSLTWSRGTMSGAGTTVLAATSHGSLGYGTLARTLVNRGTLTTGSGYAATFLGAAGAVLENDGTFVANAEGHAYDAYGGFAMKALAGSPTACCATAAR